MPKPILKKDSVQFKKADLEQFATRPHTVISSESVREIDPENKPLSSRKNKSIIRNTDVRLRAERIEICLHDFDATEIALPDEPGLDSLLAPVEEVAQENKIDAEQLQRIQDEWERDWQDKLELAVKVATDEGIKRGYEEAQAELVQQREKIKEEFNTSLKQFQESWDNYIKRSETLLLRIALEITQFIVDIPLPGHYSDITERILNETLDQLSRDTPLTLSLNPLDLLRMQESGVMELIKEQFSGIRWDPQPNLKEGNWIIQTPRQAIRRITDELLDNLKNQFGLSDHPSNEVEISSTLPGYDLDYIPPVTNVAVSTTQIPLQLDQDQIQNVVFSPATSTTSSPNGPAATIQDLSDK